MSFSEKRSLEQDIFQAKTLVIRTHWENWGKMKIVVKVNVIDGFRWDLMVLMGFDGIWWVSMGFDGIWWFSMGFDGFWWVLMGFDGIWWVLMGCLIKEFFSSQPGEHLDNQVLKDRGNLAQNGSMGQRRPPSRNPVKYHFGDGESKL